MAKVSIIVPVYNSEKYLEKCLESLAGQTLKELEVVLVNDGSTDSSLEIMESFSKKYSGRFVIINKENGGQASARNMGIKQSSGEYIGFVDSDDRVDIHMFEEMYNHAVVKNYDLVECHYHYVQEQEDGTVKELATRGDIRQHENRRDMFINPMASPWNKLYKRSVLIDGNITFPEGLIYEDTSFFIKSIPFIRSSYYMKDKFVYYYLRGNSTMNANKSRRVGDIFEVIEDYLKFYKENNFYEEYKTEIEYFTVKILLCSSLSRIGRIEDRALEKEFRYKTFDMIDKYFKNYKKNPYFTGKIGMYIRLINRKNSKYIGKALGKIMKG